MDETKLYAFVTQHMQGGTAVVAAVRGWILVWLGVLLLCLWIHTGWQKCGSIEDEDLRVVVQFFGTVIVALGSASLILPELEMTVYATFTPDFWLFLRITGR